MRQTRMPFLFVNGLLNGNWTLADYSASDVEPMGWYSGRVLLIALPVFITLLAYAIILFAEVAMKKNFLAGPPISLETKVERYEDKGPQNFQPNMQTNNPQPGDPTVGMHNPPTTVVQTVTIEKELTTEPYLWEELLVYLMFHLVCLGMTIHTSQYDSNQNVLGVVIAWLHLVAIIGYTFIAVSNNIILGSQNRSNQAILPICTSSAKHHTGV